MTAKFTFSASCLKHGLSLAKIVKPSSGDFMVRFGKTGATFYSADKRRITLVNIASDSVLDVDDGWLSDEYCVPAVKMSLFDSKLETVTFSVSDSGMTVKASDGHQTRRATVKRRSDSTRRNVIPVLKHGNLSLIDPKKFGKLLRVVGCSALVRETKTEEEMRINQVHFCSEQESAFSNARYHASIATLKGMNLDLSIIGSDIPSIRSFCAKLDGKVGLFQDKNKLYVVDVLTNSVFIMGRVLAAKSDFDFPTDEFSIEMTFSREKLLSGLDWALTALDGTQRLSCEVEDGLMKMSNKGEIFSMPVVFVRGSSFRADLPAKFLRTAVEHTDSDDVVIKFGHEKFPTIMEVSDRIGADKIGQSEEEGEGKEGSCVHIRHYLQIMKTR